MVYQYFGYGANECIALTTLGLVLGFNQVSKIWTNFTEKWLNGLFEEIRICLGKECIEEGLLKQSNLQLDQRYQDHTFKTRNLKRNQ